MSVFRDSRYTHTSAYVRKVGGFVLSIRNREKFNPDNFTYYTVIQGDTLDGIAYKKYGNAQLGWAILDANPSYQSEIDIVPGIILAIPSLDEVVRACE